jgi:large subunit ribosomal protein L9
MEVILRENVDKLGRAGDVVQVKDGYARNFLLPQGLAYPATAGNKKRVEGERRARGTRVAAARVDADAFATELQGVELSFTAKAGEGDKLFGSITSQDIADRLAERGITVDKRDIELAEPIKSVGAYQVSIRLHPEVKGEIRVWVVRE